MSRRSNLVRLACLSVLAAGTLVCLGACDVFGEPKTANPWDPSAPPLTAEQLEAEADKRVEAAERWGQDEAEKLAREADARLAEFEDAVADLEGDTAAQLRDLKRQYEADARAAADASARISREIEATRRSANEKKLAGHADLSRQWEKRDSIVGAVQMAAKGGDLLVPGLGTLLGGAVGTLIGRAGRQRREDAAYDLGKADANDERDLRDDTWDEAQTAVKPDPTAAAIAALVPFLPLLTAGRVAVPPFVGPFTGTAQSAAPAASAAAAP